MALGFTTTSAYGSRTVIPDKGMSRKVKPRVRKIQFGDGYEQRTSFGINNIEETYSVNFQNRSRAEIEDIAGYLSSLNGITAFNFTVPDYATTEETTGILDSSTDDEKTIKVVCDDFSEVYRYDSFYSLNATFRRVYEA